MNWWNKAKPYVELVGVVLIAVYTGFTVAMYFANRKAADAAYTTAITTREQVHVGQRAYLILKHPELTGPLKMNESPEVSVELFNSGQTPATEVKAGFEVFISNVPEGPPIVVMNYGYIGAGQEIKMFAKMLTRLSDEQFKSITAEEISLEGNALKVYYGNRLFVKADVRYKDVFGGSGETTLCSAYRGETILAACTAGGNEMTWENK